jgi:hypothetical protein
VIQVWTELAPVLSEQNKAALLTGRKAASKNVGDGGVQRPKEIDWISGDLSHTSSRDRACLNTLIVVFTSTNGRDRLATIPTLATVSLSVGR